MKKENQSKSKLLKYVLLVLLMVFVIFIALTTRKMIILSTLDNKVSELKNSESIYGKTIINTNSLKRTVELYFKDNILKYVATLENQDGTIAKITQIDYPNERKFYLDADTYKKMQIYSENNEDTEWGLIANYADSYTLSEKIFNSITAKIKTVTLDGKDCYEISSLCNSNVVYEQGTEKMLIYIEKDTGLPVKTIATVNDNGNKIENVMTYEYQFNCVATTDMAEPDSSQYELET